MSQRPLSRVAAVVVLLVMLPIVACVGFFLFGAIFPSKGIEGRAVDAIKGAGVPIVAVREGALVDPSEVSQHRVFTTATGKEGHILVTPRPIDRATTAARIANQYARGEHYAYWNSAGSGTVIVVLGDDWRGEHPERIDAAIKSLK